VQSHQFTGLTDAEVAKSRLEHGENILTPPAKEPMWLQFLRKFKDPLILILLVAGVLSVGISLYEFYALGQGVQVFFEPVGIFVAILLATGLGFYFEAKADKEFEVLNRVNDDEPVQVLRNGTATEVPKRDVVVGDIVFLNTGNEVPADGTLLEAVTLSIDESTLTGEPICSKTTDPEQFDKEATFASNVALRGTKVMEGHGVMKVTAVGDATENGHVYTASQIDDNVKTPLDEQFDRLGSMITRISYACAALILIGRVFLYLHTQPAFDWISFGTYMLQTFMIVVALIVVSVPEGLPMAVTLSLAYSMRRMLKTNNLVRKMHACETMGATTVICTDKTGTLTQNCMQVHKADFYTAQSIRPHIAQGIAVNSTAQLDRSQADKPKVLGNPTEGALLLWLDSQGIDYLSVKEQFETVAELPFTTERKYMATVVREKIDGKLFLYVKGAPEIIMNLCSAMPVGLTRDVIDKQLLEYQAQAMRTLGFGFAEVKEGSTVIADNKVCADNITFLGIVAISDPVRAEVPNAVAKVNAAGIDVKIVTGDTPGTAKEIGRQIGLWDDNTDNDRNITTGVDVAAMSNEELTERVGDLKIIARARPIDKKRLVEALQARGEVVAVTGDGTNDAPALKAAQVGLSMGDGTAVAKEASDITIIDNSFASIGRAVMWGRSLYRNIQRFIMFQMTVNVVASLIVLIGAFLGMQSPLTVTQMLWVNLIMDTFAAMALASLPPTPSVMLEKPRSRSSFIISHPMWQHILGVGLTFFVVLLALLLYLENFNVTSLSSFFSASPNHDVLSLTPYELTIFFSVFVFLQFWNLFNARAFATGRSALHMEDCGEFMLVLIMILVGQILIVELGGALFNVVSISFTDWLIIIIGTSPVLLLGELQRALHK
jgi:Ca2+-transporting ATPase